MKARIVVNSENLKKHFSHLYEDLFSKSSVVISVPGSFWWTGEHAALEGNLGILQKIPLRVYLGIEPTKPHEVKIGSFLHYSPQDQHFLSGFIEEPIATKIFTFVKEMPEIKHNGIILHILSEIPPGRGMNFSGALSVALSTILNLTWSKITLKEITNWRYTATPKLFNNPFFVKNLYDAWKYECIFHGDTTSGCTVLAPMIGGDYPAICLPPKQDLDHFENNWQKRYVNLDTKKINGARLNEFFEFKSLPVWSFDFGLIYSGDTRLTSAVVQTSIARKKELSEIIKKSKHLKIPAPFQIPKAKSWFSYIDALKIGSLETLLNFKEVFEKGLSEKAMKDFFVSINRYQDLLNLLIAQSSAIKIIQNQLKMLAYKYGSEFDIGTKTTGSGYKGDVLFVTAYHGFRESIQNLLDKLSQDLSFNLSLDYASWIDGIEDNAIKIEQDLASKIYSKYVSQGSVFIKHYLTDSTNHTDIYTPDRFNMRKKTMEILLDQSANDIWIYKKNLDSKQIPSTSTTIVILKMLLENLGKGIKNTQLPKSSYASDRNELQSKIISPLNKVLRSKLKKTLPIEIHGALDEFTVTLTNLPFAGRSIEKTF